MRRNHPACGASITRERPSDGAVRRAIRQDRPHREFNARGLDPAPDHRKSAAYSAGRESIGWILMSVK